MFSSPLKGSGKWIIRSPDVTHGRRVQSVEVSCGEATEETDIRKAVQTQRHPGLANIS